MVIQQYKRIAHSEQHSYDNKNRYHMMMEESIKKELLMKYITPNPDVSSGFITISVCVNALILHAIGILYPDSTGWKKDVINGALVLVIYEGSRRILKYLKRFKF